LFLPLLDLNYSLGWSWLKFSRLRIVYLKRFFAESKVPRHNSRGVVAARVCDWFTTACLSKLGTKNDPLVVSPPSAEPVSVDYMGRVSYPAKSFLSFFSVRFLRVLRRTTANFQTLPFTFLRPPESRMKI